VRDHEGALALALASPWGPRSRFGRAHPTSKFAWPVNAARGTRASRRVGSYDVYVEHPRISGLDRASACVSMALASDPILVNAARRSAVLRAHQSHNRQRGERLDGSYVTH